MMFSVIVPIYNTELYLPECIDSLLAQTCSDWEMILVNDGSLDRSGELADSYAQVDDRIRVIHKENSGQLLARRSGIENAEGEYLLFLDSDDYWRRDCLEILLNRIKEKSPDIIMFPARRIDDSGNEGRLIAAAYTSERWLDKKNMYETLISGVEYNSMCLKAWKRDLFLDDTTDYNNYFGTGWGEDKAQVLYPVTKAETILYIPEELYFYRYNQGSVIQNMNLKNVPAMISNHVFELVYEYMGQWGMVDAQMKEAIAVNYLRNYLAVYYKLRRHCKATEQQKKFRAIQWNKIVSPEAFQYMFSQRLTSREKLKLFFARYFRII